MVSQVTFQIKIWFVVSFHYEKYNIIRLQNIYVEFKYTKIYRTRSKCKKQNIQNIAYIFVEQK